jgi:4-hydroxybenzoate polyprenyltransferase
MSTTEANVAGAASPPPPIVPVATIPVPAPPKFKEAPFLFRLRRRIEEYALLARFDRPIGTWLLLWPVLWALWIASNGRPDQKILIIFVIGVVVMRAAGCIINDFADRDIDPHVKRTRERPLAARRASPREAIVLFLALLGIALALVTQLDALTILLSFIGAALTLSYPFVKRFFPLPQLYLGISFGGWGVPMAFAAELGSLPRVAWVLFMAAVIWAVIYDTMYAMVDREDDLKVGVKSSAILFADMDRAIIGIMQVMMLFALYLAGRSMQFGQWFYAGLTAAAFLFLWQQWLIRKREPASCLRAFQNNNYVGMVIFVGILFDHLY